MPDHDEDHFIRGSVQTRCRDFFLLLHIAASGLDVRLHAEMIHRSRRSEHELFSQYQETRCVVEPLSRCVELQSMWAGQLTVITLQQTSEGLSLWTPPSGRSEEAMRALLGALSLTGPATLITGPPGDATLVDIPSVSFSQALNDRVIDVQAAGLVLRSFDAGELCVDDDTFFRTPQEEAFLRSQINSFEQDGDVHRIRKVMSPGFGLKGQEAPQPGITGASPLAPNVAAIPRPN